MNIQILEEIKKIILNKEYTEAIKNSDNYINLQSELLEINNNINSYPLDERAIYEARRDIITVELNKIDDKYNFEKEKIEVKLNNIQRFIYQENEKINDRIKQLEYYKENLAISIKKQEERLQSEKNKKFSERNTEGLLKYVNTLNQFKETQRKINDELLKNIMDRESNLQDLNNLSYEKISAFSDKVKNLGVQKTDKRKTVESSINENKLDKGNQNENEADETKSDEDKLDDSNQNENGADETKSDEAKLDDSNQNKNKADESKLIDSVEEKKDVLFDIERAKRVKSILEQKIIDISKKKKKDHKATNEMEIIDYKYQDEKEFRYDMEIDFYSRLDNIIIKYIEDEQFIKLITPNDRAYLRDIEDVIASRDSNLEKLLLKQKTSIEREYNNRGKKSLEQLSKEGIIMKRCENEDLPIVKKEPLWKRICKKIPGIRRLLKEELIIEKEEKQQDKEQQVERSNEIKHAYEKWNQQYQKLCNGEFLPKQFFEMLNRNMEAFKTEYKKSESEEDKKIYNEVCKQCENVEKRHMYINSCYKRLLDMYVKKSDESFDSKKYSEDLETLKKLIHNSDAIDGIREIHYCSKELYDEITNKLNSFQKVKDDPNLSNRDPKQQKDTEHDTVIK